MLKLFAVIVAGLAFQPTLAQDRSSQAVMAPELAKLVRSWNYSWRGQIDPAVLLPIQEKMDVEKIIRRKHGLFGASLFNDVVRSLEGVDPEVTYSYQSEKFRGDALIINHKPSLTKEDIARHTCKSNDGWRLVLSDLSTTGKTILFFKETENEELARAELGFDCGVFSFGHRVPVVMDEKEARSILEVLQSEAGFTSSTKSKPIVATYGCGPCVVVGGYDAVNSAAFVAHIQHPGEIMRCGGQLLWNMSRLMKKPLSDKTPINVYLRGGAGSIATHEAIKKWMTSRKDIPTGLPLIGSKNPY